MASVFTWRQTTAVANTKNKQVIFSTTKSRMVNMFQNFRIQYFFLFNSTLTRE